MGKSGVKGSKGPKGITGNTGSQGPAGEVGPIGSKGQTGAIGTIGDEGAPGNKGPIGPIGPTGIIGITGPTGPFGSALSAFNISQVPGYTTVPFSNIGPHFGENIKYPVFNGSFQLAPNHIYFVQYFIIGNNDNEGYLMLNGKAIPNTGLWDQYRSYPNGASLTGFPTLVSTIGQPNTCTLALFANAMTTTYGISVAQPNAVINIIQVY